MNLTAGLLGVTLVVAGCSGDPKPQAKPSTSTSAPSTSTTPKPAPKPPAPTVVAKGLPADLLATMKTVYLGGKVPANAAPAAALAKRKVGKKTLALTGSTGTWKSVPIAVVTHGKDVTLLLKGPTWRVVGGWWPSLGVSARTPAPTMRVLAIGSDARPHQRVTKARADALHIIGVDGKGVGGIVGIPRDSWVPLSTGGTNKINAALLYGGGRGQTQTVQNVTGVKLDGYVMTGFKGFAAMVDAMGGLNYTSASALTSHVGKPLLKKGLNHLKGLTALNFARERKNVPGGDFGRSANQGYLIKAGMAMARANGPSSLPKYLTAMSPHLETNLSTDQVMNLAATLYITNPSAVRSKVAPGSIGNRSGQSVVLLGGGARSLFADIKDARLG